MPGFQFLLRLLVAEGGEYVLYTPPTQSTRQVIIAYTVTLNRPLMSGEGDYVVNSHDICN